MFWIISGALVIFVAMAVVTPFLRRNQGDKSEPAAAYDLRVYRDQLREVERDLSRGVLNAEDAERLRTEIGRKVLAADRAMAGAAKSQRSAGGLAAFVIFLALVGGSYTLYQKIGAPGMPDEPISQRYAMAEQHYRDRPSQAEAEAKAPRPERPAPDADYLALIEELRAAVEKNPEDAQGLALLAQNEERLGNLPAARAAMEKLLSLPEMTPNAEDHATMAALMIDAAGGVLTPEAEQQLGQSLALDPNNPRARFLAGILQLQNGRADRAFPIWAQLLAEGPETAPWVPIIRQSIGDLAWFAGQPDYVAPEPIGVASSDGAAALPGPDAAAIEATRDMTPEARQQMIQGMVSQLEARLASEGGSPEEWARLITSLATLGNVDHARNILAEARTRFGQTPEASAVIEAAAKQAGLAS